MIFSKEKIILFFIIILAATLRLYNVNWDSGHQLHPDERAIIMTVDKLKFPASPEEFLSPNSTWNPHFFAYGSLPMYLLRVTGSSLSAFNPQFGQYALLNIPGRFLSTLADLTSVVLIFMLGKKLFTKQIGLLASFFYAISVLPIQLSHFYAVDTLLTCFMLATLYSLLLFYEKPSTKRALIIGLFLGLALATKISATVLIASIGVTLAADFLLIFLKNPLHPKHWLPHLPKFLTHLLKHVITIGFVAIFTFIFFEPYALIDFSNFWLQTLQQSELTKDPFYFPYTLQYVGKIPYLYELKNVFLWGMGPLLGTITFIGIIYYIFSLFKKERGALLAKEQIIFVFFLSYLLIVGKFSVGFMRYMLPIYPLFTLFAAVLAYRVIQVIKPKPLVLTSYFLLLTSCLLWPLSFVQIYTMPNTRIQASEWIYNNIPVDKTLAVEHWDDQLPIGKPINYNTQILKLYDPDTPEKWTEINTQLSQTDYIIIASNRLYTPLQKLIDCPKLPPAKCYQQTNEYYKNLFSGALGFEKVAEFTSYPTLPLLNIQINDQGADESFTVYDHPKVMIFQKTPNL